MRTEREVRQKLSAIRYRLKQAASKGKFWPVVEGQSLEALLLWVLKRKR